ncbi:hypothetical protein QTG54_015661 [Skeletonema marinoi]|uniref:Rhodanese domain-containing protein n=1 Tax=Skeletonema marinoi TaxID=267567 RepID=A0AAD9D5F9_9STRA|nr:hypothetical protein QTG54_015661 [Skeletonema marinoi]
MNFRTVALLVAASSRSTVCGFSPAASSSIAAARFGAHNINNFTVRNMSAASSEPRKAGVSSPTDIKEFVSSAGSSLLVVDARHPDASVEPGDAKSLAVAGFPDKDSNYRPNAINLPWSRESNSMEVPEVDKDTPIITHCGGGGRGQKAKDYLESVGFTKVLNGGGPKETECWAEYGDK